MNYFILEPEVAGGWGERTVADTREFPPAVSVLHHVFDGWLGDEILEAFPCFIVTDRLAARLRREGLSGFLLRPVEVTTSEAFDDLYPGRELPAFRWLQVLGTAGVEDFGVSPSYRLVVSQRALVVLRKFRLRNCDITEYGS